VAEFNENLWAPWRMDYIRSLADDLSDEGCFLCRYWNSPQDDAKNHVVWRGQRVFVVMNRFPYTNGHLMVAYAEHKGGMTDLDEGELVAMTRAIRNAVSLLEMTVKAQGFNVGYNVGQCAGAGLPGHLHAHIVPRWGGDTNFMAVLGKTRVIPDALDALYRQLVVNVAAAGFANGGPSGK
jgi:ATP adenylyltransferase